ncbi:MAG TPA: site-2 protease family protein [Candidatus Sulfotelmatobacter sp.]|nr:site-2 protease family protein [Candidatus Sulfotelmatobacter sp.]
MHFDPQLLLLLPVLVFSVVVHECAHGLVALWCGDTTARDRGRLTLMPFAHLDPVGSLLLPGLLVLVRAPFVFGWAKPVPVDHSRLRDLRNDPVKVALAGPASNFLLALLFAGLVRVAPEPASAGRSAWAAWASPLATIGLAGVLWNVTIGLFNLIPIPPLDGSWVLMRFLRLRQILLLQQFRLLGILLILVALSSPQVSEVVLRRPVLAISKALLELWGVPARELTL